jgi:RimJ/RimL family protein N-acetyltransferase
MPVRIHSAGDVPVLETGRLTLRGHRVEDLAHSAAMWADPEVIRHTTGKPLTEEECWARLLRYVGHWTLLGFGYWVVEETATGNFIGEVGFADYKRDLQPPLNGMPESGWVLARQAHGKGYATEALRAALKWGDAHFGSLPTACMIAPENLASVRVALKCGYEEVEPAIYKGKPVRMFIRRPATIEPRARAL